ncbi:MAG: response regulator [Nitrospirae bacterium]|nr:response regulator [Nitrospirota bacterium]MBI3392213.1 response regulator [Nitrospirota bacterium]
MTTNGAPLNILIIDDDEAILYTLQLRLESLGYTVWTADTAASGISTFRRVRPDVVLLDIRLPDGDGLEILRTLRVESPDTIVLVITAQGLLNQYMKAMSLDAQEFLHKPISAKLLDKIIRTAVENKGSSGNPGTIPAGSGKAELGPGTAPWSLKSQRSSLRVPSFPLPPW